MSQERARSPDPWYTCSLAAKTTKILNGIMGVDGRPGGTTGLSARLKARFHNRQFLPSEPSSFQIWTINLLVLTFKIQLFACLFVYTGEGLVGIPPATGGHGITLKSQSSFLLCGSRDRIQTIPLGTKHLYPLSHLASPYTGDLVSE